MATKTKGILLDAARDLFAEKGKSEVTMYDIAKKAQKGRRTIYTYFKSKDEIYQEVVSRELDMVLRELEQNLRSDDTPYEKIKNHVLIHLDAIEKAVARNGTLRATFFKDILEVERYRKQLDKMEIKIIRKILQFGVLRNNFKEMNVEIASILILSSLKGLEVPYITNTIGSNFRRNRTDVLDLIFTGIAKENIR